MMNTVPIAHLSASDTSAVNAYLTAAAPHPCIVDNATDHWTARNDWTLEHFVDRFGDTLGRASFKFGSSRGLRAMKLRHFITHSDKALGEIPGFWINSSGLPTDTVPDYDEAEVWTFMWHPFANHEELFDEIAPFPAPFANLAASAAAPGYRLLERLTGVEFHSLYITRAGTVVPLHRDHDHTFGCLVQFDGRKQVVMLPPGVMENTNLLSFNPEAPDFAAFPQMQGVTAQVAELQPGDMLIIPPDWWHYTRSLTPSLTMSHNFFNPSNAQQYLLSVTSKLADPDDRAQVRQTFAAYLPTALEAGI